MLSIEPTGAVLGATVHGIDVAQPIGERDFGQILAALGRYGVLRFPDQQLDMGTICGASRNASARSRVRVRARRTSHMSGRCRT